MLLAGETVSTELLEQSIYGKPAVENYSLVETVKQHNEQFEEQIEKRYNYGNYKNYK